MTKQPTLSLDGCQICMRCKQKTLPIFPKDSVALETVCQNPTCRMMYDRDYMPIGIMEQEKWNSPNQ